MGISRLFMRSKEEQRKRDREKEYKQQGEAAYEEAYAQEKKRLSASEARYIAQQEHEKFKERKKYKPKSKSGALGFLKKAGTSIGKHIADERRKPPRKTNRKRELGGYGAFNYEPLKPGAGFSLLPEIGARKKPRKKTKKKRKRRTKRIVIEV